MSDEKKLSVTRVIDASAADLFDLLTLPQRHKEFDGSGLIVSDDRTNRLQKVGDKFTMNMNSEAKGDYQTVNEVTAFAENKVVGWATSNPVSELDGWSWTYVLEPQGPESTEVTLNYDWSGVEDKQLLSKMPMISKEKLEESLNLLAAAVA